MDAKVRGVLRHGGVEVDLEFIRGVYLRPYDLSRLQVCAREVERARVAALNETLLAWSEVTPARVVNRPSAMASNHSKPCQSALIHAQGFDVPRTLLTTDPDAVEAFWEHHQHIIYKSISGVRSIVSRLTPKHRERFASLSNCPTQFQEWIEGVDIRVHVVGDDVFASRSRVDCHRLPLSADRGRATEDRSIRPSFGPRGAVLEIDDLVVAGTGRNRSPAHR